MSDAESPVCGTYDICTVTPTTFTYNGESRNLCWINEFAFYVKWCDGNEQIWIYDTQKNCAYQVCNQVTPASLGTPRQKYSDKLEYNYQTESECLGQFGEFTFYANTGNFGGNFSSLPITWINPMSFVAYFGGENQQFWVKDPEHDSFLQIGAWANSVHDAFARAPARTHARR